MMDINKRITLQRDLAANNEATLGKMRLEWLETHVDLYSLELPKGSGGSGFCITQGLYNCILHDSPKHPHTWQLLNVPNRTEILIHNGNYLADTQGCILVGLTIDDDKPMVGRSVDAMNYLRKVIGGDNFSIEIKD